MGRKNKGGKELAQTKDQTPLLPLSGSRKVVRTPTNPFEAAGTIEVFVPKEIIARRIQHIFAGPNKGRKADHYLVVWEDYPLEKDYTWEPIENLYGHEDLAQTYEQWLKTENERLDSVEAERKTARKMTAQKVQDVAADQFRKNDKFTKKAKGTDNTSRQTLHQEVEQDEAEAAAPEFTESMLDMDSVFEFELMARWVPQEPEAACSVVKDASTPTATNSSLIPTASRVSGGISMSSFLARNK
jgi:hypothetical protein